MNTGDTNSDRDQVPIVIEAYGVKVNLKSRADDLGEQTPASWREVPRRVNQHLMRIAVAPTRLVAEVLEGATRLIRGLSRIPSSVANRLQRAHDEADFCEGQLQEIAHEVKRDYLAPGPPQEPSKKETPDEDRITVALNQIQALLQKYKDKGLEAYIILEPGGKPMIALGTPPGSEPQVLKAIEQNRALLNASTGSNMTEQEQRNIARKILQSLYDAWERHTIISLNKVQEQGGWERSIFRTVVDKLENQHGLIKSAGTSYSFEMTPAGVIYAEENEIVPMDRVQWHEKIRQHVLAFLAGLYDKEGNRAHEHYEKIAKGAPVEDSMKILQDLSLLTELGYLEAASVSTFRITEEGMRHYRGTDYEDLI